MRKVLTVDWDELLELRLVQGDTIESMPEPDTSIEIPNKVAVQDTGQALAQTINLTPATITRLKHGLVTINIYASVFTTSPGTVKGELLKDGVVLGTAPTTDFSSGTALTSQMSMSWVDALTDFAPHTYALRITISGVGNTVSTQAGQSAIVVVE